MSYSDTRKWLVRGMPADSIPLPPSFAVREAIRQEKLNHGMSIGESREVCSGRLVSISEIGPLYAEIKDKIFSCGEYNVLCVVDDRTGLRKSFDYQGTIRSESIDNRVTISFLKVDGVRMRVQVADLDLNRTYL